MTATNSDNNGHTVDIDGHGSDDHRVDNDGHSNDGHKQ